MLILDQNPWIGLLSYETKDAKSFFGRENETNALCASIKQNYSTVIYGKSGMGKTSLINAGLMPTLAKDGFLPVSIRLEHNTEQDYAEQIVNQVKLCLETTGCEAEPVMRQGHKASRDALLWFYFHTNNFWTKENSRVTPVVFIDQFEEIFTLCEDKSRMYDFFKQLNDLFQVLPSEEILKQIETEGTRIDFNESANFRLVLSLREDFLPRLEDCCREIPALRKNRIALAPMTGEQALEVIMRPVPDLVEKDAAIRIIEKVSRQEIECQNKLDSVEVEICILSLFCSQLYKKAVEQRKLHITTDIVERFGDDIIDDYYKDCIKNISKESLVYLEDNLLTNSGYRNALAYEDVVPVNVLESEIKCLEAARLIRVEEVKHNVTRIEFTHDVLCRVAMNHKKQRQLKKQRQGKWSRTIYSLIEMLVYLSYPLLIRELSIGFTASYLSKSPVLLAMLALLMMMFSRLYMLKATYRSSGFSVVFLICNVVGIQLAVFALPGHEGSAGLGLWVLWNIISMVFLFVKSFKNKRKVSLSEMMTHNPVSLLKTDVLSFVLLSYLFLSCMAGYYMVDALQIVCFVMLIPIMHICAYKNTGERLKSIRIYIISFIGFILLGGLFVSQYVAPYPTLRYLYCLILLPVTYFGVLEYFKYSNKNSFVARAIRACLIWVIFFVLYPYVILGYNIYGLGNHTKCDIGVIGEENGLDARYVIVEDYCGRQGVISRSGDVLLPVQFEEVFKYASLQLSEFDDGVCDVRFTVQGEERQNVYLSDYLQYENEYTESIFSYYEKQVEMDIKQSINNFIDKISDSSGENFKADKNSIGQDEGSGIKYECYNFRKNPEVNKAFDLARYVRMATYYSAHNEDSLAFQMLSTYVRNKFIKEATDQFLREGNWASDNISEMLAASALYLAVKNKFGEKYSDTDILSGYNNVYVRYFRTQQRYQNQIEKLIFDECDVLSDTSYCDEIIALVEKERNLLSLRNPEFNNQIRRIYEYKRKSASQYSPINHSFSLLFMGEYERASEISAEVIAMTNDTLIQATASTNLLTSYLFRGDYETAKNIFHTYKHLIIDDKFYRDWVLQDISEFENLDILPVKGQSEYKHQSFVNSIRFPENINYDALIPSQFGGYWAFVNPRYNYDLTRNFVFDVPGRLFYMDEDGRRVSDIYDDVQISDASIVIYSINNKRGYYDIDKKVPVTAPEFEHAWFFSDGLAAVVKNNRVGFIDSTGNFVIPCMFDYVPGYDYVFKDGCARVYSQGAYQEHLDYYFTRSGRGYAIFADGDKVGLINKRGEVVLPIEYDNVGEMHDGLRVVRKLDKQGVIGASGELLSHFYKKDVIIDDGHFAEVGNVSFEAVGLPKGRFMNLKDYSEVIIGNDGISHYAGYNVTSEFVSMGGHNYVVLYDDDLNRAYAKIVKHEAGTVTLQIVRDNICQYPEGTFLFYSRR